MLFAVVRSSTEIYESELNINSKGREELDGIIPIMYCDKVKFVGIIEGKSIADCKKKVKQLNEKLGKNYRLYGKPFTRKGNIIYMEE